MNLSPRDTARFYRAWWPLLRFVNAQLHLAPDLEAQPLTAGFVPLEPATKIRDALWENDTLRERFAAENPAGLPPEDLELVTSWQHRVAGTFYMLRHLKKYTIFLSDTSPAHAYGVLGLLSRLDEVIRAPLPVLVEAVLLPFDGRIIYDGILRPYRILFGPGIRANLNATYRRAKECEGILTSLPPQPSNERTAERQATEGTSPTGKGLPGYTEKQGQYLAFIHYYTKINRRPPAEADIQRYFDVSAPAVHQMVLTLERRGLIAREPGKNRSIRVLVPPEDLPPLA